MSLQQTCKENTSIKSILQTVKLRHKLSKLPKVIQLGSSTPVIQTKAVWCLGWFSQVLLHAAFLLLPLIIFHLLKNLSQSNICSWSKTFKSTLCLGILTNSAVNSCVFIFLFFFLFVVNFVIHWNETAMGLHVFPIPIPPPPPSPPDPSRSSQYTRSERLSRASNLGWWSVSP